MMEINENKTIRIFYEKDFPLNNRKRKGKR